MDLAIQLINRMSVHWVDYLGIFVLLFQPFEYEKHANCEQNQANNRDQLRNVHD